MFQHPRSISSEEFEIVFHPDSVEGYERDQKVEKALKLKNIYIFNRGVKSFK